MTVVSTKEFNTIQDLFVDDMNMYHDASVYEEVLEPDDDLRRAITAEELLERIHEDIRRKFASRK
jgi:hypothetical protein